MAMRRPKKMSRSRGTLPAISRLGPGIETVDVRFTPTMGWESGDVLSRTTCGETRSSPWLISWEVGVGTSVDRGLRLARLRRTVAQGEARGDGEMEHFVLGELQFSDFCHQSSESSLSFPTVVSNFKERRQAFLRAVR